MISHWGESVVIKVIRVHHGQILSSLTLFPNNPWFLCVFTSSLKTLWEKEKLLVTSNFSLSHIVFYPFEDLSAIFIVFEIVVCKLKFVVWERVNVTVMTDFHIPWYGRYFQKCMWLCVHTLMSSICLTHSNLLTLYLICQS